MKITAVAWHDNGRTWPRRPYEVSYLVDDKHEREERFWTYARSMKRLDELCEEAAGAR